jgi:predicted amidophosphoribosyltransferase
MLPRLLFNCVQCKGPLHFKTFPICEICAESLVLCPPLCPNCMSADCALASPSKCIRPWICIPELERLQSITARYFLVGQCHRVLKKWKTTHGPIFDLRILTSDSKFSENRWLMSAEAIIPIPQRLRRAWSLGGSPADRTAHWLSAKTGIPIYQAIKPSLLRPRARKHQAELGLQDRITNSIRFDASAEMEFVIGKSVLIVDDFTTTGKTLRTATRCLKTAGVREVHAFCLGVRPRLNFLETKRPPTSLLPAIS